MPSGITILIHLQGIKRRHTWRAHVDLVRRVSGHCSPTPPESNAPRFIRKLTADEGLKRFPVGRISDTMAPARALMGVAVSGLRHQVRTGASLQLVNGVQSPIGNGDFSEEVRVNFLLSDSKRLNDSLEFSPTRCALNPNPARR